MKEIIVPTRQLASNYFETGTQSRRGYFLLALLALLVLGWGGLAQISGAVIAPGQVTLESSLKRIQHRDGGIVSDILVHEGDRVKAGQVLVRLDSTVVGANEAIIQNQLWQLMARKIRLEAERDGKNINAVLVDATAPPEYQTIIAAERRLMASRQATRNQQKGQLREQITQSEHEVEGLQAQIDANIKQSILVGQELVSMRSLYEKKYAPFSKVSELEREADRLEGERGQLTASIARSKAQASQLRVAILQVDSLAQSEIMADLKDTETKLSQATEQQVTASDALRRVEIKAPVTGKVQQLTIHTRGGVVAPGETLMLVVPESDELIVEVRIDPSKVDSVHIGGKAHVRFTAFDSRITPEATGRVDRLSSDVETDDKTHLSFYRARLTLNAMSIPKTLRQKLVAGMPVEVQIETGSRNALSYFLKPLTDQLNRTFRET